MPWALQRAVKKCWDGGIGIRASLRSWSRKGCEFESRSQHFLQDRVWSRSGCNPFPIGLGPNLVAARYILITVSGEIYRRCVDVLCIDVGIRDV